MQRKCTNKTSNYKTEMKKHDYYITSKKKPTAETFKDAEGNIIIPTKYVIKGSDTNEQKGQKNRMWLAWQKRRKIEPVTDLPNFQRVRKRYDSDIRRTSKYTSVYKEQRQRYSAEQLERIAKVEQRIAELQKQRDSARGARYDELTTQINILRCKIVQTKYPVYQCDTAISVCYEYTEE